MLASRRGLEPIHGGQDAAAAGVAERNLRPDRGAGRGRKPGGRPRDDLSGHLLRPADRRPSARCARSATWWTRCSRPTRTGCRSSTADLRGRARALCQKLQAAAWGFSRAAAVCSREEEDWSTARRKSWRLISKGNTKNSICPRTGRKSSTSPGRITSPSGGKGDPNEEGGAYQRAIGVLYAVAYTLKMSYKTDYKIEGFVEYVVPPLEGFWWRDGADGMG